MIVKPDVYRGPVTRQCFDGRGNAKHGWRRKTHARSALRLARRREPGLEMYCCGECGQYHLGHGAR